MAEGRYNAPELAKAAMQAGASSITIGSAITRIEHICSWFKNAVDEGRSYTSWRCRMSICLAIDIGGTKIATALICDGIVSQRSQMETPSSSNSEAMDAMPYRKLLNPY